VSEPRRFRIRHEADVAAAVIAAREVALAVGLGRTEAVHLATAVSEVAGNQVRHAGGGVVEVIPGFQGVTVEATDDGPGIDDVELALTDGYSTRGGLGLGLPGARRLVDEFAVSARPGGGTRVRLVARAAGAGPPLDPAQLADWAVAGSPEGVTVAPFSGGLLLAVSRPAAAAAIASRPAALPSAVVDAAGGSDVAVVSIAVRDGHLAWQAEPGAGALLVRDRLRSGRLLVLQAPRGRSATFGALRGDLVVLANHTPREDPRAAAPPQAVADAVAAAGPPGAVVLAARLRRGVLERRR
jgi:serine/threonine-protein kinase RsbT